MKPQLSSIAIAAKDLLLLRQFYTEVFGWEVSMENEHIIILKLNGTLLSLCSESLFTDYTGVAPSQGKSFYFTIGAGSAKEVDDLFVDLQAKGANITKTPAEVFWGGYIGFLTDPEGNLWEVSYNPF